MAPKENWKATETSVQIENVNFHALIAFLSYLGGERSAKETLLHKHVFYELFVCQEGEIEIKTTEGNILLSSGDIAIIPPTYSHVLKRADNDTKAYIISFLCKKTGNETNTDLYKKLMPIVDNDIHIFNGHPEFVLESEKIVTEAFSENVENFLTAVHLLELFLKIANSSHERDVSRTSSTNQRSNDIERMMLLDSLINTKYFQKYSASDYAKELFISTRQLDRISIKRYGKSMHQLILDIILKNH